MDRDEAEARLKHLEKQLQVVRDLRAPSPPPVDRKEAERRLHLLELMLHVRRGGNA